MSLIYLSSQNFSLNKCYLKIMDKSNFNFLNSNFFLYKTFRNITTFWPFIVKKPSPEHVFHSSQLKSPSRSPFTKQNMLGDFTNDWIFTKQSYVAQIFWETIIFYIECNMHCSLRNVNIILFAFIRIVFKIFHTMISFWINIYLLVKIIFPGIQWTWN